MTVVTRDMSIKPYWKKYLQFDHTLYDGRLLLILVFLTLRRYTYFYWHRGYTWPKKSRHLLIHEKGLQKISQYFEILFGDPILCSNRFCSNLFSDCLFITIYSDENISRENFVMSLLGHVYLRRVKISLNSRTVT